MNEVNKNKNEIEVIIREKPEDNKKDDKKVVVKESDNEINLRT